MSADPKPTDPPQLPDDVADKLLKAIKAMPKSKNSKPRPPKGDPDA